MRISGYVPWVLLLLAAALPAAQPAEGPEDARAKTQQLLLTPVDVHWKNAPLDKALEEIARQVPGLKIVLDQAVRGEQPALTQWNLFLTARHIPACEVLDLIAGPLVWEVQPGGVRVTTTEQHHTNLSVVLYPIWRLRPAGLRKGERWQVDPRVEGLELGDIIQRTVGTAAGARVAPWQDEGGTAEITHGPGVLAISQTPEGHERIASLLAMLGRALGVEAEFPPPPAPPAALTQALERTRRLLDEPIDVDFEAASLDNVLGYIQEMKPGLQIVIDSDVLTGGLDLTTRAVSMKIRGLPVGQVLGLALGHDLGYRARPGYVLIATAEKLGCDLPMAVYPVRELCARSGALADRGRRPPVREIIDLLKRFVNNTDDPAVAAWSDEGGPAAAECFGDVLVVSQTERGHVRTGQFLRQLRTAAALALAQPSRPRGPMPAVAGSEPPGLAATSAALETRVDVDWHETPFMQAVEDLAYRPPPLNIVFHPSWESWTPWVGPFGPFTLKRSGVPREVLLAELLGKQVGWEMYPGYVLIARDLVVQPHLSLVMYPVRDQARVAPDDLLELIKAHVNNNRCPDVAAWTDEGGPAVIDFCCHVLIVYQKREAHRRINALLQELGSPALDGM